MKKIKAHAGSIISCDHTSASKLAYIWLNELVPSEDADIS